MEDVEGEIIHRQEFSKCSSGQSSSGIDSNVIHISYFSSDANRCDQGLCVLIIR